MEAFGTDYKFDINKEIPDVFAKLSRATQERHSSLSASSKWDTEGATGFESPSNAIDQFGWHGSRQERYRVSDLFHKVADGLKNTILLSMMSLDLTRVSSLSSTRFYEIPPAVQFYLEGKRHVLPPSKSLVMCRNDVQKSSLFTPSGALLTWLEMLEEKISDDE